MECYDNPLRQGECAKIWRADDIGDLELLHARYISYSFARHTHEGAAVGVIEEGAESFYYRGATHIAPAGQIIVFNPSEAHSGQGAVNEAGASASSIWTPAFYNGAPPKWPGSIATFHSSPSQSSMILNSPPCCEIST